jgi:excisionase family DNA binding protein
MSTETAPVRLLYRPREAAEALALSERTLWTLTHDGTIPAFRTGRIVRYYEADLRKWIEENRVCGTSCKGYSVAV